MQHFGKIAGVSLAMAAVLGLFIWLGSVPAQTPVGSLPEGSLARAVAEYCDGQRLATFSGDTLDDAITCRDLAAQESMALSTERVVWLGWAQLGVAIGGAFAVVWTVLVALNSLKLTQVTLEHQQTATRLAMRPRFKPPSFAYRDQKDGRISVDIRFPNHGPLAALRCKTAFVHGRADWASRTCNLDVAKLKTLSDAGPYAQGAGWGRRLVFNKTDADAMRAGTKALQIAFLIYFDDELGGRYYFSFQKEFTGANLKTDRTIAGLEIKDFDHSGRSI